jgi:hypothetical protein
MVDEPTPMIESGLKLAVAPDGKPSTVNPAVPLNPFDDVRLMV